MLSQKPRHIFIYLLIRYDSLSIASERFEDGAREDYRSDWRDQVSIRGRIIDQTGGIRSVLEGGL